MRHSWRRKRSKDKPFPKTCAAIFRHLLHYKDNWVLTLSLSLVSSQAPLQVLWSKQQGHAWLLYEQTRRQVQESKTCSAYLCQEILTQMPEEKNSTTEGPCNEWVQTGLKGDSGTKLGTAGQGQKQWHNQHGYCLSRTQHLSLLWKSLESRLHLSETRQSICQRDL